MLERSINEVENEKTKLAKQDVNNKQQQAIDKAHPPSKHQLIPIQQQSRNLLYNISTTIQRTVRRTNNQAKHVRFANTRTVRTYNKKDKPIYITYDSGADGHYLSGRDRIKARLPILCKSEKIIGVANGNISRAQKVTRLPFKQLSQQATMADTFTDFPYSLMSVGKTSDNGTISILTKEGVTVNKEHDVLITCKGKPILIKIHDEQGRYRIPLTQQHEQWQPRKPSKQAKAALLQANNAYYLPSTEQAIRWMHAVFRYPVKSIWLKAIKAGNVIGWPLLTEKNVAKYYPEMDETPKGHMNQTQKNVRSTKNKQTSFEQANTTTL